MLFFAPWKQALIFAVVAFALLTSFPNAFYDRVQSYSDAQSVQLDQLPLDPQPLRSSPITRAFDAYFAARPRDPARDEIRELVRDGALDIETHWVAIERFFDTERDRPTVADPTALLAYERLERLRAQAAARDGWPSWLPSGIVNLGLDLQGGSYFLLEADVEAIYKDRTDAVWPEARTLLRDQRETVGPFRRIETREAALLVRVLEPRGVEAAGAALSELERADPLLGGVGDFLAAAAPEYEVSLEDEQTYRIEMSESARGALVSRTMDAAIEVVRTRVDALGTREPTIVRQGTNRILLQLPGASDVDVAALTKVAKLEFQMVAPVSPADIAAGRVPRDVEVLDFDPELNPDMAGQRIAVFKKVDITGDELADASRGTDQDGRTGVNIRFDPTGARIFSELSRNIGSQFAMVLDGQVLSAPQFREYIPTGVAIITGQFTPESAEALAINLRSGNLPTTLSVEESSVVGPELGADSVAAGRMACIIGFIAVLIYMALSYGWFGVLANVALLLNVMLIFGALSTLGATLTLPGIAGIVLTIGMAVDANVLVFERIREELRRGRGVARAIETGYERALSAIIDANVTTFIAAAILFFMGSGPVRGFSVTLGIGIITSVFTAVMLTRFFVATWFAYRRPKTLTL